MMGKTKGSYLLVLALAFAASFFTAGQAQAADYSLDAGSAADANWLVEEPEFLPVDEAFRLSAVLQPNGTVLAQWRMADGYYLYRHQFGAKLNSQGGDVQLGELQILKESPRSMNSSVRSKFITGR
jgi:thiol:disulfide interchange protein